MRGKNGLNVALKIYRFDLRRKRREKVEEWKKQKQKKCERCKFDDLFHIEKLIANKITQCDKVGFRQVFRRLSALLLRSFVANSSIKMEDFAGCLKRMTDLRGTYQGQT